MPFNPEKQFPDLSRLRVSLNNSRISIENNALFQTIEGLINKVEQLKDLTVVDLSELQVAIDNLTSIVNNINIGAVISGDKAWMPVFDGIDGEEPFLIPGPTGPRGEDGKTIYLPSNEEDYCEPPYLGPYCCGDPASSVFEITTTGNIDDLDFANAAIIRFDNASLSTLRGLKAGKHGQVVKIVSVGTAIVEFDHQAAGSAAANRLTNFATSANTPIAAGVGSAVYMYDATDTTWRMISHFQGRYITPAFAAGDWTANGAMTFTVAAGDVLLDEFYIDGNRMQYNVFVLNGTVGGVANTLLQRAIPYGFTTAGTGGFPAGLSASGRVQNGGAFPTIPGILEIPAAATLMRFYVDLSGGANWTIGANNAGIAGNVAFGLL